MQTHEMDTANASGEQMTGRALARHSIIVYHERMEILFAGLNKCHAPISRIKPFEHLLSLIVPLFLERRSTAVNDFLKISILHI